MGLGFRPSGWEPPGCSSGRREGMPAGGGDGAGKGLEAERLPVGGNCGSSQRTQGLSLLV